MPVHPGDSLSDIFFIPFAISEANKLLIIICIHSASPARFRYPSSPITIFLPLDIYWLFCFHSLLRWFLFLGQFHFLLKQGFLFIFLGHWGFILDKPLIFLVILSQHHIKHIFLWVHWGGRQVRWSWSVILVWMFLFLFWRRRNRWNIECLGIFYLSLFNFLKIFNSQRCFLEKIFLFER